MKKKMLFAFALVFGIAITGSGVAMAVDTIGSFPVTATVPSSNAISFVVSKVDSSNHFTPNGSNNLNFGELNYNSDLGIYYPSYSFAIDVAVSGGAGNPDVKIEYSNTNNPNGVAHGLEEKGVAVAQKVSGPTGNQTVVDLIKATLGDINNQTVYKTSLTGGFMRLLVGLATGNTDPTKGPIDPPNAVPFTNGDQPGSYTGTLKLTATLP